LFYAIGGKLSDRGSDLPFAARQFFSVRFAGFVVFASNKCEGKAEQEKNRFFHRKVVFE
jgi:hypothetical protein